MDKLNLAEFLLSKSFDVNSGKEDKAGLYRRFGGLSKENLLRIENLTSTNVEVFTFPTAPREYISWYVFYKIKPPTLRTP